MNVRTFTRMHHWRQKVESILLVCLLGFNIGVELGQLSVIAGCYLLAGIWFGNKSWYHNRVTIPGSLLIGAIGCWWFYQRVLLS